MQVIKQNAKKTTQCKYDMQRGKETRTEKPNKTTRCEYKQAKAREDGFDEPSKNHTMQVHVMQRGKKIDVENHRKASDARRETENRGPAACIGVKACAGGDKMRKAASEMKSAL